MALVTRDFTYSAGAVIVASQHNTNENTLYTLVNGNLNTSNLSASAGIVDTQLAQISSASKVNVSALIIASQATGDLLYASSASAFARLAVGTSSQVLIGGTTPAWSSIPAAAQSDMETATSTTLAVTPGRQHFHPGSAKAWCKFDGTTVGTNAPTVGYGVTSVTRNSEGNYTINFSVTFSSANYVVVGNCKRGSGNLACVQVTAQTTTTATIIIYNQADAVTDGNPVYIAAFGDF